MGGVLHDQELGCPGANRPFADGILPLAASKGCAVRSDHVHGRAADDAHDCMQDGG